MRVLADENFPKRLVTALRAAGHDVLWARTDCLGWPDSRLLDLAESESRILFTFDKDYEQIVFQRRVPLRWGGVVLFRIHANSPKELEPFVRLLVDSPVDRRGFVSIVTADEIRVCPSLPR